jgi:hypothetical protein
LSCGLRIENLRIGRPSGGGLGVSFALCSAFILRRLNAMAGSSPNRGEPAGPHDV